MEQRRPPATVLLWCIKCLDKLRDLIRGSWTRTHTSQLWGIALACGRTRGPCIGGGVFVRGGIQRTRRRPGPAPLLGTSLLSRQGYLAGALLVPLGREAMACRGLFNLPGKGGLPGLNPSLSAGGSRHGIVYLLDREHLPGSLPISQQASACRGLQLALGGF